MEESKLYSLLLSTLWTFQDEILPVNRCWGREILSLLCQNPTRQPCIWPSEVDKRFTTPRRLYATAFTRHSTRQQLFSPLRFISGPGRVSTTGNELQPSGIRPQASHLLNSPSSSSPVPPPPPLTPPPPIDTILTAQTSVISLKERPDTTNSSFSNTVSCCRCIDLKLHLSRSTQFVRRIYTNLC